MVKHCFKLFLICIFLWGCKKEHDRPQWDIGVLAPLFKASISVDNLIADSLKNTAADGAVALVYNQTIYSVPVDSIFKIPDTTIYSYTAYPLILPNDTLHLVSGFTITTGTTNKVNINLSGAELTSAYIKRGFIRIRAQNHLPGKVKYFFQMTKATLAGNPFVFQRIVDAAPAGGVTVFDSLFDMTGYLIDLTGNTGQLFNQVAYDIQGQTAEKIDLLRKDTLPLADVATSFIGMLPVYARGYLGQNSTTASGSKFVSVSKLIQSGTINLDSVTMKIIFQDSVGADAQALLTSLKSINNRTSITIPLSGLSVINHSINLNRATENGPYPSSINPSTYTFTIGQSNSNLLEFIENLPDSVAYDVKFNINPLGNIAGHNDFIYTDSLFNASLDLRFPLRFAANQLSFVDTQSVSIANKTDFDAAGPGTFTLIADNGFPWEMDLQIFVLDANNQTTDAILVPGIIAAAPVNGAFRAVGKQRSKIDIPVDENRKKRILDAPRIALRASLSTVAYPQVLQVYSDYTLDLKLIADAKYLIR